MNTNPKPKRCHGEAGVTLQELLIAMIISAIIAVPIAGAIFTSLHTTTSTLNRTQQSVAANLVSTYFGTDVQNTVQVTTNATEPASICGAGVTTQPGLLLTTSLANSAVFYWQGTGANSAILYRQACAVGATNTPSAGPALMLVRQLSAPVQFSCAPDCTASNWRTVSIQLTQSNSNYPGAYATTVQASRRVS